jgi:hypothetical protein
MTYSVFIKVFLRTGREKALQANLLIHAFCFGHALLWFRMICCTWYSDWRLHCWMYHVEEHVVTVLPAVLAQAGQERRMQKRGGAFWVGPSWPCIVLHGDIGDS